MALPWRTRAPSKRPHASAVSATLPSVHKIHDLVAVVDTYLKPEQVAEIYRAYLFGAEAHEGQCRMSGEPYIFHPLAVALILAEMRLDYESIIAALLHDVMEDTGTRKEELAHAFGEEVAELVDGVSKLTHIHFESKAEAQAENFRKMMLAMVRDLRVILIKLADRLHNMRTLGIMRPDKCRRIARETLEIYAPIAHRLGMNRVRLELEELGFAAHWPLRHRVLAEAVRKARGNRREVINRIETSLGERLQQEGITCEVQGRQKHLYSLYRKMVHKHLSFGEVLDLYAFRIVVDSVDTCYRVLGVVHNLYKPKPGTFKDYIAIPKANGYQSLHTVLFNPYGFPIEVQIRTRDMDQVAEAGIAAHWLYKTDGSSSSAQSRARDWLRGLLELQQYAGDSMEFLEHVKIDLFPDEVYVFTPQGEIRVLPRGATPVDFAYAVHSDVGNTCVAARVNQHLVPLRSELLTGQTVEIITAAGARPNPAWLDFVVTAKARSAIRNYLKNLKEDDAIALGRRLLERALGSLSLSLDSLPDGRLQALLAQTGSESLDQLLAEIGLGKRMPLLTARALAPEGQDEAPEVGDSAGESRPLSIRGTEGMVVSFARCCRPIPGDSILGFLSAGRGIVIHTQSCKNVGEFRNKPDKWIDVQWEPQTEGEFPVEVRAQVANQRGVLATVAAAIAEMHANIEHVQMDERDGSHSSLTLLITVTDRRHLARILRRLRHLESVLRIQRTR